MTITIAFTHDTYEFGYPINEPVDHLPLSLTFVRLWF